MSGDHFSLETLPENEIVELLDQEVISTFIFFKSKYFFLFIDYFDLASIYSESYIYRIRLHPLIKHLN